ncbi:hypothetical protein L4C34_11310 [Vibrio profundum]|uniref:tetratricopeptide repeat protein n=1 Tax=Vibrio profundum TaxID=2910247 RepID=UPI003D133CAD
MKLITYPRVLACAIALLSTTAYAQQHSLLKVQKDWAVCQYQTKGSDKQTKCFEQVITLNKQDLSARKDSPELMVWLAINKASLAGAEGGLSGLSQAKQAKKILEQVIEKSPETLQGSAYTSLGSLYYKVPGWPIGFGDDKKAEQLLKKALKINPNGIDSNYFYGDFLAEQGKKQQAIKYLTRAKNAAARPDRPLADQGRQQDISKVLESLK